MIRWHFLGVFDCMQKPIDTRYPAIFLMGPTAVGKTQLALEIAEHLPVEIVSVDSALVYRGMDIGTSKPTTVELQKTPHHLIDICDPSEVYSAARFVEDALQCMNQIRARKRIPLLVGGTSFYFKALREGLSPLPSADPEIRARLLLAAEQQGWGALYQRLSEVDPKSAARIHANDTQRIQRALEIYELCHKPLSDLIAVAGTQRVIDDYQVVAFARLPQSRALLHEQIKQRFQAMLKAGFVDEVKALWKGGDLDLSLPSMRAVGYRQIGLYLAQVYDYSTMVQEALVATRRLAKHQLTWIRQTPNLTLLENTHSASLNTMLDSVAQAVNLKLLQ